eukprot:13831_1
MMLGHNSFLSVHWASLLIYLCIYITGLIGVTIIGWGLYQAKPKNISQQPSAELSNETELETAQKTTRQNEPVTIHSKILWTRYFTLWRQKWRILLSICIHITIQALNFSVMTFFLDLAFSNKENKELTIIAIISLISFILYRFGSAILIYRHFKSIRKSTFQIIDITILYQLLKGYKKTTRNPPHRIIQYINYLNAMFQSWTQATVQLVFLLQINDNNNYMFIYIILFCVLLNIYCLVKAVYEKDMLLTTEFYRKNKTVKQISIHIIFRIVDISLRIIILSMLWITISLYLCLTFSIIEFIIISYLAFYTKQMHRLQEMIAVILYNKTFNDVNNNVNIINNDKTTKIRPVTPATLRMTNELSVSLNINLHQIENRESERKRQQVKECKCFKWRIIINIFYIIITFVIGLINGYYNIYLTIYCIIASILYPCIYLILNNSNIWTYIDNDTTNNNVFAYLNHNDFESAKEILDFGKTITNNEYIEWANNKDFSADNNPIQLLKFLNSQQVKINDIRSNNQGGLNILHQVCKNPELTNISMTIEFLIKLGFNITEPTSKSLDTPLHIACSHCNKNVMLSLLNNSVQNDNGKPLLFVKNKLNQTPLHSLMIGYNRKYEENQISMTKILFEKYNAQQIVLEVDIYGKSLLHIACKNSQCPIKIIKLLLENGSYSNQACNDDFLPFDHVQEWDDTKRKSDKNTVLKWLKYGINEDIQQINVNKSYVELSDDTRTLHSTPKEEEIKRIYETDDENKNDNEKDKNTQSTHITPIDPNPDTTLDKTNDNQS